MNIKSLDLNLLRVFAGLYEHLNVSHAAKELGLSQPAMSHALQRLRDAFNDQLFVRAPRGIIPTPRAKELGPIVQELFLDLERKLVSKKYSPKDDTGVFNIRGTDYFEQTVYGEFVGRLFKLAPQIQIISKSNLGVLPKEELEKGDCDLAIAGFFGELPSGFYQQLLFEDHLVGLANKKHPIHKNTTLKEYLKWPHLVISGEGKLKGPIDQNLAKLKVKRNVSASTSSFMSAGWILQDSNLLLGMPARAAFKLTEVLPLETFELPFSNPTIKVVGVWHESKHKDQRHQWMRRLLYETCQLKK